MNAQDVIKTLKDTRAMLVGHFELRSGLHSDQYFQCALVLQETAVADKLCAELARRVKALLGAGVKVDGVISPAMGGIVVGQEVGRSLGVRAFFAEKDKDGKLLLRRGFKIRRGENLVVAEDVVTRGGRVQETIDIVKAAGGNVVAVAVLVNRSGGKAKFDCPIVSLVEMEPVTHEPSKCPLCAKGLPIEHPGS